MNVLYPFQFDGLGRTASASNDQHIRDLIEQVLFTAPGERVNNPTFGCGLLQLPFQPNSDQLQQTTEFLVYGALSQILGNLIDVQAIVVDRQDSAFTVTVSYVIRRSGAAQLATFERTV